MLRKPARPAQPECGNGQTHRDLRQEAACQEVLTAAITPPPSMRNQTKETLAATSGVDQYCETDCSGRRPGTRGLKTMTPPQQARRCLPSTVIHHCLQVRRQLWSTPRYRPSHGPRRLNKTDHKNDEAAACCPGRRHRDGRRARAVVRTQAIRLSAALLQDHLAPGSKQKLRSDCPHHDRQWPLSDELVQKPRERQIRKARLGTILHASDDDIS